MATINLHHGDCLEAMKQMPDKAYDLAIVDPPYLNDYENMKNLNQDMKGKKARVGKYHYTSLENAMPDSQYFDQLKRVSKNQIIWGFNYFIQYFNECPSYIVWDKNNAGNFADCESAWCSKKGGARVYKYTWNGMIQGDMKNKEVRIHPTQKPVALYKWLLHNYAKEGDKILDTHGGSMSIAIACHDMNFDLDLWELDEEYYTKGVERFNRHKAQLRMF